MKSFLIIAEPKASLEKGLTMAAEYLETPKPQKHPDLFLLKPETAITINQIRQLNRSLSKKPFQAKIKVALIHQAQCLTLPAQNALLKTIEEPPNNSFIILTTANQNRLLPTVVSRCQIIKFSSKAFEQKNGHQLLKLNQALLKNNLGKRLVLIQPYLKNREAAKAFVLDQISFWRTLMIKPKTFPSFSISRLKAARILSLFSESMKFLDQNVNHKLCLDNLMVKW